MIYDDDVWFPDVRVLSQPERPAPTFRAGKHRLYLADSNDHQLIFRCNKCWKYGAYVERWAWKVMMEEGRMAKSNDDPDWRKKFYEASAF